jgi:hypothetical protein
LKFVCGHAAQWCANTSVVPSRLMSSTS